MTVSKTRSHSLYGTMIPHLGEGNHSKPTRPSLGGFDLPSPYDQYLHQIEAAGWDSVKWNRNYNMLHWAASKGQLSLCRYLVQLGGDRGVRDDRGQSPADAARIA